MTSITALWLPILVSAVLVFVASSVIHMLLPWHKSDYAKAPREDELRAALRPLAIPPGDYMVPHAAGRDEMKSAEFLTKLAEGPVLMMTVMPNSMMNVGRKLGLWFLYVIIVSAIAACVAAYALAPGAPPDRLRFLTGVVSFMAYGTSLWPMSIWYERSTSATLKATVDGVIYAVITAMVFGWMWP